VGDATSDLAERGTGAAVAHDTRTRPHARTASLSPDGRVNTSILNLMIILSPPVRPPSPETNEAVPDRDHGGTTGLPRLKESRAIAPRRSPPEEQHLQQVLASGWRPDHPLRLQRDERCTLARTLQTARTDLKLATHLV
jgi:hypothetical protein